MIKGQYTVLPAAAMPVLQDSVQLVSKVLELQMAENQRSTQGQCDGRQGASSLMLVT